jgi:S-DNA-T family DNA segregation ATPase FtsK/SpoIIIE
MRNEVIIAGAILISILCFLSMINVCGKVGGLINDLIFGLFGALGYLFPFFFLFVVFFFITDRKYNSNAARIIFISFILLNAASICQLAVNYDPSLAFYEYFSYGADTRAGGGFFGGILLCILCPLFDSIATAFILVVFTLIFFMLLTRKRILTFIGKKGSEKAKRYGE